MEFRIDHPPPRSDDIAREREKITSKIKDIRGRDLILTSILVLTTSAIVAAVVFWLTDNLKYAAIAAAIYPIASVVLNVLGITTNIGFRSAALQLVELNNQLIALKPISEENPDVGTLSGKYREIAAYVDQVKALGRDFVNGELAMFWGWDSSTAAKTAKARSYVNRARKSIADAQNGGADDDGEGEEKGAPAD
jgi:hypothetical protein